MPSTLNVAQTAEFNDKGFTYARGLFAPDEVKLLTDAMEQDPAVRSSILDRRDGEGRSTRIALWNRAGDSVYGLAARCQRMVDTSAALLGGPVYHYQSKLTAKEPEVGGAWEWHQDYGYWYYNGCIRPDLLSIMVALDKTTRENGCLQIATGSHKLGRIDHTPLSPTQSWLPGPIRMAAMSLASTLGLAKTWPCTSVTVILLPPLANQRCWLASQITALTGCNVQESSGLPEFLS